MSRSSARWVSTFVVLALGSVSCKRSAPQSTPANAPAAVPVQIARVVREDVEDALEISGVLHPLPGRDVKLGALSAGRVAEVRVSEGDAVQKGDLLLRLERTPLADAVAQAEANVAQARAQLELARKKLKSAEAAFDAGVAARQEVEDARAAQVSAESALRSANAAASTAYNELARSELRAPFDGWVAQVSVAAGEQVDASGKPLVEVVDNTALELRGGVPSQAAAQVRPGMQADVQLQETAGGAVPGTVIAVAPVVDAATGLVTIRIRVDNPGARIKAGTPARARIVVGRRAAALTIPRSAVVPLQQGESAPAAAELSTGAAGYAVEKVDDDGRVHRQQVTLGASAGDRVEVRSGLSEGDRVVAQGAYALPDGTPVTEAAASEPSREPTDGGAR